MSEASTLTSREGILAILNDAFADRFHSLAAYVLESGTYLRPEDAALRKKIETIAESDRDFAHRLADVIENLEGIPQVPAYSERFAEFNYLSLEFLRDRLREELARQLEAYEKQLPLLERCAAARNILYLICQRLREHIAGLK